MTEKQPLINIIRNDEILLKIFEILKKEHLSRAEMLLIFSELTLWVYEIDKI